MTTRELRLWHWIERGTARYKERELMNMHGYNDVRVLAQRAIGDFHLSAVQVLNDCPDCIGTTAEQDQREGIQ